MRVVEFIICLKTRKYVKNSHSTRKKNRDLPALTCQSVKLAIGNSNAIIASLTHLLIDSSKV